MKADSYRKRIRRLEKQYGSSFMRVFFGEKPGPVIPAIPGNNKDIELHFDEQDEGLL